MYRDQVIDCLEAEKRVLSRKIVALSNCIDPAYQGSIHRKVIRGKEIFYCYKGKAKSPKCVYLGQEGSAKFMEYKRNMALCSHIERLHSRDRLVERMVNDYNSALSNRVLSGEHTDLGLKYLDSDPRYQELLKWQDAEYEKNSSKHREAVILAYDGTRMRSKDECMIYNKAAEIGLPFRYDSVVEMRNENGGLEYVSPDFVYMDFNHDLIIHEHLGLLEKEWYASQFAKKLNLYTINGYELNTNLFLTTGSHHGGVNSKQIQETISLIEKRIWLSY